MIVTSGYNVAGPEVEQVLLEHPAVSECGITGVPDLDRGQIIKAFVALYPGHSGDETMAKELQDYVKQKAARCKYPRSMQFLDALPRTETGKLRRFKLQSLEPEEFRKVNQVDHPAGADQEKLRLFHDKNPHQGAFRRSEARFCHCNCRSGRIIPKTPSLSVSSSRRF